MSLFFGKEVIGQDLITLCPLCHLKEEINKSIISKQKNMDVVKESVISSFSTTKKDISNLNDLLTLIDYLNNPTVDISNLGYFAKDLIINNCKIINNNGVFSSNISNSNISELNRGNLIKDIFSYFDNIKQWRIVCQQFHPDLETSKYDNFFIIQKSLLDRKKNLYYNFKKIKKWLFDEDL